MDYKKDAKVIIKVTKGKDKGKKWIDLFEQREKLEGIKIVRMMKNLSTCQYILNKNFQELSSSINYYEKNPDIWNIDNRKKLDDFQNEFIRYLHNYLASTYSLLQHTRYFCTNLDNSKFNDEYNKKIGILITNDCLKFIQELRNYITHYKLPLFSATLSWHATGKENREGISEQKLVIHKEDLLKYHRWSLDSKNCICLAQTQFLSEYFFKFCKSILSLQSGSSQ